MATAAGTHSFGLKLTGAEASLVVLRPGDLLTVGRDALNNVQLGHGSIEPFHARLRCDDWGVWIASRPAARTTVAGELLLADEERLVPLGGRIEMGALGFDLVVLADAAPTFARPGRLKPLLEGTAGFLVSLLVHVALLWSLAGVVVREAKAPEEASLALLIGTVHGTDEPAAQDVLPTDRPLHDAPIPVLAAAPEFEAMPVPDFSQLEPLPDAPPDPGVLFGDGIPGGGDLFGERTVIGVGASGGRGDSGLGPGSGSGRGLLGSGRLSLDGDLGVGKALVGRLKALRGVGVDLVFVMDATSSMRPFLDGARNAAGSLVSQLAVLIEDLRVGVVAYRDEGDEFETKSLPLSDDRYAILNFIWGLRGEGGGDLPEAVATGLEVAIEKAGWRAKTHHVIVLIGDAPPHEQDWGRIKSTVGRFVRGDSGKVPGAIVSVIFTGPAHDAATHSAGAATRTEDDGYTALAEIARLGRGDYLDLGDAANVGERLLMLILGPRHAVELKALLARVQEGPREKLIRRRVEQRDVPWLLERLRHPPVHPAVVDALADLADRRILWEARKVVLDTGSPLEAREAALYLLRRCIPAAAGLLLEDDFESQRPLLHQIEAVILRR